MTADPHLSPVVVGKCPACGRRSLILTPDGRPLCWAPECPDDAAAAKVLELDHRHVLELRNDGSWSIEHPVTCRLDDRSLIDCAVHANVVAAMSHATEPITGPGRFYLTLDYDSPRAIVTTPVEP